MARKAKEVVVEVEVADVASESTRGTRRIQINSKYTLCMDKYSMWIEEFRKTQDKRKGEVVEGEGWYRVAGYCGTFDALVRSFVRNKFRSIEADDVEELISRIDDIQKETLKLANDIVKKVKNIDLRG